MLSTTSQAYNQIQSKLFVDDNGLQTKLEALKEVESTYTKEMNLFQEHIKTLPIE